MLVNLVDSTSYKLNKLIQNEATLFVTSLNSTEFTFVILNLQMAALVASLCTSLPNYYLIRDKDRWTERTIWLGYAILRRYTQRMAI